MQQQMERFWYPFTATTVIARKLVPLLLFTLGVGLFVWAGREFYFWQHPWLVLPSTLLGLVAWLAAGYFFTLLPPVRADENGVQVLHLGLFWRRIPWETIEEAQKTAEIDLLGWAESFYTVYIWRTLAGRRGKVRRTWHRRRTRAFRFSGHIRNSERLLDLIEEHAGAGQHELPDTNEIE